MNLAELVAKQRLFDAEHGWVVDDDDLPALLDVVSKDVVGLLGEIGEFANVLKKLNRDVGREAEDSFNATYRRSLRCLSEELVDTLIYLIRIAAHLDVDLEREYARKLEFNRERYRRYESDTHR